MRTPAAAFVVVVAVVVAVVLVALPAALGDAVAAPKKKRSDREPAPTDRPGDEDGDRRDRPGDDRDAPEADVESKGDDDADLDALQPAMPGISDFGYFLSRLNERDKGRALNVLGDLSADSRLDPRAVSRVLQRLLDEGVPPEQFGFGCDTCFQRRLSDLLEPLRLQGPKVDGPSEGVVALWLDDRFLFRMSKEAREQIGGSLTGLVQALLNGYVLTDGLYGGSYPRFHQKGRPASLEPLFFSSGDALAEFEAGLREPLEAWTLGRWLGGRMPTNRFEPGYILLFFDPAKSCDAVRIPTAGDTEDPNFRPTPASERRSGFTSGGAPQWVCKNLPLREFSRARFVANERYIEGINR